MRKIHFKDAVVSRVKKGYQDFIIASYLDKDQRMESSILLAGSGRSGSTWLADVIGRLTQKRVVFEPLLPNMFDKPAFAFRYHKTDHPDNEGADKEFRLFVPANMKQEDFYHSLQKVFSGNIPRNRWRDRRLNTIKFKGRVIKDIRTNLYLPYISNNFPKVPLLCIMRHPCAVISSQYFLGWQDGLDEILKQEDLVSKLPEKVLPILREADSLIEKLSLRWCIENYIPLTEVNARKCCYLSYEHLAMKEEEEWEVLLQAIGFGNKAVDKQKLRNIKGMTKKKKVELNDHKKLLFGWKNKLSNSNQKTIMKMVTLFGLNQIYNLEDPLPDRQAMRKF